jgi:hypothetical protein
LFFYREDGKRLVSKREDDRIIGGRIICGMILSINDSVVLGSFMAIPLCAAEASTDYAAFTNGRAAARSLTGEKAERAIHRSRFDPSRPITQIAQMAAPQPAAEPAKKRTALFSIQGLTPTAPPLLFGAFHEPALNLYQMADNPKKCQR